MAEFRAASLLTFANSQRIYLAFDCGRFGNPAEETLVLVVWDGEQARAAWLPIQVVSSWGDLCPILGVVTVVFGGGPSGIAAIGC